MDRRHPADPASARPRPMAAGASVLLVMAAVYSWFASGTRPFTLAADLTTAVPLAGMATVYVLQRLRPRGPWRRLSAEDPPAGGTAVPWLAVVALLVATECTAFFGGPRPSHPTLSTLTDTIFQWHAAKAAVYFAWLWLCWYFVRR